MGITSPGGSPGGSNTQVQFNDSGVFGGDSGFTYNKTTDVGTIGGVVLATGGSLKTSTSAANTALLQAYDVDGAAYTTFGTLTANNTPTFDLATATTIGGVAIGNVTGAASSTDNAAVRFDGAGGKTIQNSGVIIDDSNNVTGVVGLTASAVVIAGSGTISAPGFAFNGDADTGLFNATDNTIGVALGAGASYVGFDTPVGLRVAANAWMGFNGSNSTPFGTINCIFSKDGAALIGVHGANVSTVGFIRYGASFLIDNDGRTITEAECGTWFSNSGATGLDTFNLPTAKAGMWYGFVVEDTDGIKVVAGTSTSIRLAGSVSASAGFIQSTTIGDVVVLLATSTTTWVATTITGSGWAAT